MVVEKQAKTYSYRVACPTLEVKTKKKGPLRVILGVYKVPDPF